MLAINAANVDTAPSYGGDRYTTLLQQKASTVFEKDVAVFPVATGTAANALALSQLVPPYSAIYCHEAAHIVTDECGAPELFTGGAKLIGFPSSDGKITAEQLAEAVEYAAKVGVHHVAPGAVSITQSTECGTVYDISQISAIGAVARHHRLPLHMDGARFANALVHLGCSPAEATWKNGVDVLSLGATKNGALCAEAVIFFDMTLAQDFERRRKRGGHLWSKARFLSAQLLAYLESDLWLLNARQANAMAARLASGLKSVPGVRVVHPVQANEVFAVLPEARVKRLEAVGFEFYRWPLYTDANGTAIRLVTSYMTRVQDVEDFLAALRAAASQK